MPKSVYTCSTAKTTQFLFWITCIGLFSCTPKKDIPAQLVAPTSVVDSQLADVSKDTLISFSPPFSIEEEYHIHDSSIAADPQPASISGNPKSTIKAATAFSRYTQKHLLSDSADYRFIADRNLLVPFTTTHCNKDSVVLQGEMWNHSPVEISMVFKDFVASEHQIAYRDGRQEMLISIDGKRPFGSAYGLPKQKISNIKLRVDSELFSIPNAAFADLYEVYTCEATGFERPVQAFTSLNQEYVYLYIVGGSASETYFTKLVCSKNGYITRIISDYWPLSIHNSFHEDFIGF